MTHRLRRGVLLVTGLLVAGLLVPAAAWAAPAVTLSAAVGPPTTPVTISGTGFGANELVDVYAGSATVGLTVASTAGAVSYATTVPATAQPGPFWFTLAGRRTQTAAQAAFTVRTDVRQPGFGATQTADNPYENTLTTSSARSLETAWTQPASVLAQAVVAAGRVYVVDSTTNSVVAYDAATGALLWRAPSSGAVYTAAPVVVGSIVVVSRSNSGAVGLNATTGATVWSLAGLAGSPAPSGPPTASGSTVFLASTGTKLRAVNATTGAVQWTTTTTAAVIGSVAVAAGAGLVVGTLAGGVLIAWSATTGVEAWETTGVDPILAPTIAAGLVVVPAADATLCALSVYNGSLDGCATLTSGLKAPVAVAGGQVYGVDGVVLTCWDLADLSRVWTRPTQVYGLATPFVAGGVVWTVGVNAKIYATDALTGAGAGAVGAYGSSTPLVADGRLYVADVAPTGTRRFVAYALPVTTPNARPDVRTLSGR